VICVARSFWDLPENIVLAILLHEMGHIYAGPRGDEEAANKQIKERAGIVIYCRDSPYGEQLEYIPAKFNSHAKQFLGVE
jgi:predicted HD phosphohydrolase